jgi:hypothetical protein
MIEWMALVKQGQNPQEPIPHYSDGWRNSWWQACWDDEYNQVKEEHQTLTKQNEARRKARIKASAIETYQTEARTLPDNKLEDEILLTENLTKLTFYLKEWEKRKVFPEQAASSYAEYVRNEYFKFELPQEMENLGVNRFGPLLWSVIAAKTRAPLTKDQARIEKGSLGGVGEASYTRMEYVAPPTLHQHYNCTSIPFCTSSPSSPPG